MFNSCYWLLTFEKKKSRLSFKNNVKMMSMQFVFDPFYTIFNTNFDQDSQRLEFKNFYLFILIFWLNLTIPEIEIILIIYRKGNTKSTKRLR